MLTKKEGELAVKLARESIEKYLRGENTEAGDLPPVFNEVMGVFVTLKKTDGSLRGCIGYPYPIKRLKDAIVDSAISAATQDPRFPSVRLSEMDDIVVEVTILTEPMRLKCPPREIPNHIEIGKHGLIVKYGPYQGLLLPQVPVEHGMDVIDFLSHTCMKAGLPPDMWLDERAEVYCFEGQIFEEEEPQGKVVEKKL
ncbi:TIGR00296 family protein [Methanosarcinales archaeon]|nr:MAG: TIGR00296 family protein [Methanosarcinales archaeon]